MKNVKMLLIFIVTFVVTACGGVENRRSQLANDPSTDVVRRSLKAEDMLDLISRGTPDKAVELPPGTTDEDIEAGLKDLEKKVRPKQNDLSQLEADQDFEKKLKPNQKQALNKLKVEFEKNVKEGKLKVSKKPDGTTQVEAIGEKTKGDGKGRDRMLSDDAQGSADIRHAIGNGYWSWSYSTSWWGRTLYVNHNFLWYLCAYTSWMLDNSGLPSWAKYVLNIILCAPHSLDSGANGSKVYVTWLLVFWYSP